MALSIDTTNVRDLSNEARHWLLSKKSKVRSAVFVVYFPVKGL